jgi:hypothetical protein
MMPGVVPCSRLAPSPELSNSLYNNQQILTFYGIRKTESRIGVIKKNKYNRIDAELRTCKNSAADRSFSDFLLGRT